MDKPKVGNRVWHIDWCARVPKDAFGDSDFDRADYRTESRRTKSEALAAAEELVNRDAFGTVIVTEMEFTAFDELDALRLPHIGFWESIGEPIYVERTRAIP